MQIRGPDSALIDTRALRPLHYLLQSLRPLAKGRGVELYS